MSEPVASLNGRLMPLREASVSVIDDGLVQGATVTERIRTFRRQPFLLKEHLQRLKGSLERTGIAPAVEADGLEPVIREVLRANADTVPEWEDFAVAVFVTPGPNEILNREARRDDRPTVCVHALPVTQPYWAEQAANGLRLITPSVRQMPSDVLDPRIKHRSRLHWFVAHREVAQRDTGAMALLVDAQGHVTETSTGNLLVYDGARLLTPRADGVLGGLSLGFVRQIAADAGIATAEADLRPADVIKAGEAFLSSTGYCLLPITSLNGRPIGTGEPGPVYRRLMNHWSNVVGLDILAQFDQAAAAPAR